MDITTLFKACVKTIRTRNRAFGVGDADRSRIFGTRTQKSEFTIRAKEVLGQITRLRDFLLEHRKAYLNFASHLSDTPQMTDVERDKIDLGAQRIMNTCSYLIQEFKKVSQKLDGSAQLLEHRQAVLDLVESYLKSVCKIYSEQRAIRVKRALEIQKMSKLETESKKYGENFVICNSNSEIFLKDHKENRTQSSHNSSPRKVLETNIITDKPSLFSEDDQLSTEEMQMFESENAQLYNELNSLTEEVKQIESKVVCIAELQEIFTEKVLQQDKDIDRIASTVIGTTENVKDANEQIRQAIQRNAGLRVWILFFLAVMSFTLLFLDWYND
ncbi:Syntaxin-18 [Cryptotermes secundus]|uniref:Syntaxin-18 n=1 Tax=Cryptotermes secundus TaxID=105785 RepID=A0A2J7R1B9_9NEOP|nr:syntaxin-18 [Cryptotermes secundus]XP_023706746.1 syntaxin-18 [Cryptotermes secundus]XP_023706748.1 syntaxin-18 [Cryptotermes secundus]XP_023706749.1 syntaxin-18 [Cryptotermes secundus]XP_023706751.1 syntaxin-18 [Cryptotermes secundus]XP_023706753.1 syntaxin-18 [Cryptotermes secundus]XP_033607188.1 syntaxin-18 [Cryptotermes secundus]XP_033607189.1 syntaxin-18 [Cryptotermes secundus]XP_033607190.1 syntaxin-18 [Cryptotermes secundus]XP_033607191.1 syntaxin-18 [Cryptotermes secundus]PNF34